MERRQLTQPPACRREKITKSLIQSEPLTGVGQRYVYDLELRGFGLCVGSRTKSFFVETTIKGTGKAPRLTIGRFGPLTLDEGRQKAAVYLAKMHNGIDPRDEERQRLESRRQTERSQVTLKNLWQEFESDCRLTHKPSTLAGYANLMKTAFGGAENKKTGFTYANWHDRRITEISRDDVFDYHRLLGEKSGPSYANLCMRLLGSLMSFAITKGRIKENPVQVLRRRWFKERPRTGHIPVGKLGEFLRTLDDLRYTNDPPSARVGADFLEFALMTGVRREEAARLRWTQVDWERRTVTWQNTKNGDDHALPMPDHLMDLLERRREETVAGCEWVFPSSGRKKGKGHISEPRYIADLVGAKIGHRFMIHDLRRSFTTHAERLDIPAYALRAMTNHRMSGDVTNDYVIKDVERLRDPMEQVVTFFLTRKADAQGMRLAAQA
jgi:integrase